MLSAGVVFGSQTSTSREIVCGWKAIWPPTTEPAGLTPVSESPLTPR
jgi:hypothetical protein